MGIAFFFLRQMIYKVNREFALEPFRHWEGFKQFLLFMLLDCFPAVYIAVVVKAANRLVYIRLKVAAYKYNKGGVSA